MTDPAPARFLPEFDNLMLAYTDRSRLMSEEDGSVSTTTSLRPCCSTAWSLSIQPFRRLTRTDCDTIAVLGSLNDEAVSTPDLFGPLA